MTKFIDFCKHQHDIECNQKYNKTLPYSFHLSLVANRVEKFDYLLDNMDERFVCLHGAWGHDLIEDARVTYNDIKIEMEKENFYKYSNPVADIIYACTELRGKNRDERHGAEYIQGLKDNKLGLFVKLCDISANIGFGILTNSSMVNKYKFEFPKFKESLYLEEYKDLFEYIEKQLGL
jgi:(p)ppGpp synthase/HD superfamily hydrolase